MRRDSRSPVTLMTMGIAGFFLAGFFLLVIFGAQVYQEIVGGQASNNHTRELMGYLVTCAKANDSQGAVRLLEREDGPMLVIADGDSGYAFRIYKHDGALVEDYGPLESQPNPQAAMVICETEVFSVEEWGEGTFAVTTDAGVVLFHARSGA